MNDNLTAYGFSTSLPAGEGNLPDSIQWMPPGPQDITPSVNGQPKRLRFTVQPQHAAMLNERLQQLRDDAKAGIGDEPYLDFNHDDQARSAEGLEFYWGGEDPKTGGIRLRVAWSGAGKEAVTGRTYRRFSPQWDFDKFSHEPKSIGTNLGGLVNRAAFKNIAPVIAKDGGASTSTHTNQMDRDEFVKIVGDALKPTNDRLTQLESRLPAPATAAATATAAQPNIGDQIQTAVAAAMKPVMDQIKSVETNAVKAQAKAAIQPHIERGAIAPNDNDTIAAYETMWTANAKVAEAQMAKLPGTKGGRLTFNARNNPTEQATAQEPEGQLVAMASALLDKNPKIRPAEALIAAARTAAGQGQYMEFRKSFMPKPPKSANN